MKYVKMNVAHPNHNHVAQNAAYTLHTTIGFVEGQNAGKKYRWSGDAIKACCEKKHITYKTFYEMAVEKNLKYRKAAMLESGGSIDLPNWTPTPSYQSIVGYVNGRVYQAQAKFEDLDEAKKYASTRRPCEGISRKTGKPWEVTIEKRENLMTGETIYMVLTPEYHRWCPKQDIHKLCAEVMDDLNKDSNGWTNMTGRKCKAQSKRKAS